MKTAGGTVRNGGAFSLPLLPLILGIA